MKFKEILDRLEDLLQIMATLSSVNKIKMLPEIKRHCGGINAFAKERDLPISLVSEKVTWLEMHFEELAKRKVRTSADDDHSIHEAFTKINELRPLLDKTQQSAAGIFYTGNGD